MKPPVYAVVFLISLLFCTVSIRVLDDARQEDEAVMASTASAYTDSEAASVTLHDLADGIYQKYRGRGRIAG